MKHLKRYALLLTMCVIMYNVNAQEANKTSFSLQEAIEYAMKNSPSILNADLDMKNAEYKRKETAGIGLPQVKGSFDLKDYIEIPTQLIPAAAFDPTAPSDLFAPVKFGTKYNATAGLSASQIILSSDYIFALKAQEQYLSLSKISLVRSKTELVQQVSKAYYTVLISRDRIKALEANVKMLKKTFDDTKAMNEQGLVELIDVERLEVQYNNLATELEKITRLVQLSEAALKFQMGYNLENTITLTDNLEPGSEQFQQLAEGIEDIKQRPDFQLLTAQQNLLDVNVKRLKWGYMPTLAAYGSYQFNSMRNKLDFFQTSDTDPTKQWYKIVVVGLTLDVTIFNGFQRRNQIQQAKIASMKSMNDLKNLEMGAKLEIVREKTNYNNAVLSQVRQKKNMELAQHVYEVAAKKYESGVGSNIEVVNAQTSLTEAQTNYYNAVFDLLIAKIDYQKATGTLVK